MASETKALTLRIPAEQARQLEVVARVDNVTMTAAIRAAIDAHIEARRLDRKFQKRLRRSLEQHRQELERLSA